MAGLFWGLNQIIPGKPSLARPASGFFFLSVFFFFYLSFLTFITKCGNWNVLRWNGGERGGGRRETLGFRALGAPFLSLGLFSSYSWPYLPHQLCSLSKQVSFRSVSWFCSKVQVPGVI